MIGPVSWHFLNLNGDLNKLGWQNNQRSKLWRYNQHYFDDLNSVDAKKRVNWHKNIIEIWVKDNPLAFGLGWDPYPTSLRIVNWVKWVKKGNNLSENAIQSLAVQSRWLAKRIEWHLLGNHLFVNAKALIFSGLFFEGDEADLWLLKGMNILKKELPEQFLSDGGQFELSPMYHALAVIDLLDL